MFAKEKVLDDIARMAGGTVSALSGISKQIRQEVRARIDEMALKLDLVPREEFERLEMMLQEARKEQEKQNSRIAALEKSLVKKKTAKTAAGKKR